MWPPRALLASAFCALSEYSDCSKSSNTSRYAWSLVPFLLVLASLQLLVLLNAEMLPNLAIDLFSFYIPATCGLPKIHHAVHAGSLHIWTAYISIISCCEQSSI